MEEARYVAIGMPRVLVRTPYGAGGETAETFGFEELPRTRDGGATEERRARHEAYLWGNPAWTMAEVLAALFVQDGWTMDAGATAEVIGLPVHSFADASEGNETRVTPCAEAWVTERGAEAMRGAGGTPLISVKGRDGVRIPGIIAWWKGGGPLAGRWG
jgi:type VI secretion system protein ImpC